MKRTGEQRLHDRAMRLADEAARKFWEAAQLEIQSARATADKVRELPAARRRGVFWHWVLYRSACWMAFKATRHGTGAEWALEALRRCRVPWCRRELLAVWGACDQVLRESK